MAPPFFVLTPITTDILYLRFKSQAAEIKDLNIFVACRIGLSNFELLRLRISNLSDAIHIRIAMNIYRTASFRRFKADHCLCGVGIFTADLECEEVTRTPIIYDRTRSIEILDRTSYFTVFNFYITAL